MIIYSKNSSLAPAAVGKLITPIKMIIEHESDLLTKKGGVCDWLFNVEKSNKFGETIIGQNDFDVFAAAEEGAAAEQDTVADTYKKFIEHIQFMKEFVISAEMMEDANYGIASDAKRRAENFVRAYYKTITAQRSTPLTLPEQDLTLRPPTSFPSSTRITFGARTRPFRRRRAHSPTTLQASSSARAALPRPRRLKRSSALAL